MEALAVVVVAWVPLMGMPSGTTQGTEECLAVVEAPVKISMQVLAVTAAAVAAPGIHLAQ
jgi:hypothetical protein